MKYLVIVAIALASGSAWAHPPEVYKTEAEEISQIPLFKEVGKPGQYHRIYSQWVDVNPGNVLLILAQAQFENTLGRDIKGYGTKVCRKKRGKRTCVKQGTPVRNVLVSSRVRINPYDCEWDDAVDEGIGNGWNMTWNSHYAVHTKTAAFNVPAGLTNVCITLWAKSGSTQAKPGDTTRVGQTHGYLSVMKWSD